MRQTGYKCNRVVGTSRCQKKIDQGRCPAIKEAQNCCGRVISGETITQPDSVFGDLLRESILS